MQDSMTEFEYMLLLAGTLLLLTFTWQFSVRAGRYHGLYRFFAFESLLILVLLNWRFWFDDPFSWNQVISWVLLFGSVIPAVEGFRLLRTKGAPEGQFENTTRLVTSGIYRFIRHPLYASLLFLGLGICFKQLSVAGVICAVVDAVAIAATARREEKEMIQRFGVEYQEYMRTSKMFIPYVL
jgi:protein-S-isoprenylcysteine O-methyltransferase Ste14